jgi:carboxypeptidase Q
MLAADKWRRYHPRSRTKSESGPEDTMKRFLACALVLCVSTTSIAQSPVDLATIARIKQEGLANSQVTDHVSWLSDVYGPRVTGTPQLQQASEWAMKRFTEWGLADVHQERFAFGQGWRVERFSAHLVEPQTQPIIGYPRSYSPSTKGTISAEVMRVDIRSEADFAKYAGKLRDRIVLPQTAREVRMLDGRVVLRANEKDLEEEQVTPIPPDHSRRAVGRRRTRTPRLARLRH